MTEGFVCLRIWGARVTRAGCASRWRRAERHLRGGAKAGEQRLNKSECAGCPLGRAHDAGDAPTRWPAELEKIGGEPIRLVQLAVHASVEAPAPAPAPTPLPSRPPLREEPPEHSPGLPPHRGAPEAPRAAEAVTPAEDERMRDEDETGALRAEDPPPRTKARRGKEPKLYSFRGALRSVREVAALPEVQARGLVKADLYNRLRDGWTLEEAVLARKRERRAEMLERLREENVPAPAPRGSRGLCDENVPAPAPRGSRRYRLATAAAQESREESRDEVEADAQEPQADAQEPQGAEEADPPPAVAEPGDSPERSPREQRAWRLLELRDEISALFRALSISGGHALDDVYQAAAGEVRAYELLRDDGRSRS
ncbi:MAG: hypothetical protein RLO52_34520 [Sandaracinaceae bacterium]